MRFVNGWMLVLVLLVPVAGAFWTFLRARSEARLRSIVAPALQRRLLPNRPKTFLVQAILLLSGLALCLFAAARPQWGHSQQVMAAKSRNVVVALDVSRSMLADDVRPNRLERAKADIADLVDRKLEPGRFLAFPAERLVADSSEHRAGSSGIRRRSDIDRLWVQARGDRRQE